MVSTKRFSRTVVYSNIRSFSIPSYNAENNRGEQKFSNHKYFEADRDDFSKYTYLQGSQTFNEALS